MGGGKTEKLVVRHVFDLVVYSACWNSFSVSYDVRDVIVQNIDVSGLGKFELAWLHNVELDFRINTLV